MKFVYSNDHAYIEKCKLTEYVNTVVLQENIFCTSMCLNYIYLDYYTN